MKIVLAALGLLLAASVAALPEPVAAPEPAPVLSQSGGEKNHQPWQRRWGVVFGGSIISEASKRFVKRSIEAAIAEVGQQEQKEGTEKVEEMVKRAERKTRPFGIITEAERKHLLEYFFRLRRFLAGQRKSGQKGKTPGRPVRLRKREEGTAGTVSSPTHDDVVTVEVVVTKTTAVRQPADIVTAINTKTISLSAPGSTGGDTPAELVRQTPEPAPTTHVPTAAYTTTSYEATPLPYSSPAHHQSPSDDYPPLPAPHTITTVRVVSTVTRKKFRTMIRGKCSRPNCSCNSKSHYHHYHHHHYHHHNHHHRHSTVAEHSRPNTTTHVHYSGYYLAPVVAASAGYGGYHRNDTSTYYNSPHHHGDGWSPTILTETLTPHSASPTATTRKFKSTSIISSYVYYYA